MGESDAGAVLVGDLAVGHSGRGRLPFAGQLLPILAVLSPAGVPLAVFGGTDGGPVRLREMLADLADTLYRHISSDDDLPVDLLTLRAWCGQYLTDLADLSRAVLLLEATLADFERVLGAGHPDTLGSRSNLAYTYQVAGDLGRAIPLHEATLADRERVLGRPRLRTPRRHLRAGLSGASPARRSVWKGAF
ncbi:tetratricopeptide repeat protein [Nonomuraea sp. NPDC052129]|uniref:tetratricopeptide repeat protein n=1 Tax=Nonomuraea sp. NPDC052129 TaxID=3154651 RepID=UPI003424F13F